MEGQEIDLRELFLYIWNKKVTIVTCILLAMVSVLAYNIIFVEKTYKSNAAILISSFSYDEIKVTNIPFGVYLNVAKSDQVLQKIIEVADLYDKEGEYLTVSNLRKMATVSLDGDYDEVGYLVFEAITNDAQMSSTIVNTWAEIMLNDIFALRKTELNNAIGILSDQYAEIEKKLNLGKQELRLHKETAHLENIEKSMDNYREQVDANEKKIIALSLDLALKKTRLETLNELIAKQQDETGAWLGVLNSTSREMENLDAFETVHNYRILSEEFLTFQKESSIRAKEIELTHMEKVINAYREEKTGLEKKFNLVNIEKQEIEYLLAREPQWWRMQKTFGEDKLWDRIFSPEEIAIMSQVSLNEEIINPVYQNLRTKQAEIMIDFAALPTQIAYLDGCILEVKNKMEQSHRDITALKDRESRFLKDLQMYEDLYGQRQREFSNLKNEYFSLALSIEKSQAEINILYGEEAKSLANLNALEKQYWSLLIEREGLEHKVKEYDSLYWRLSDKMENAYMASSQQIDDIHFVTKAYFAGEPVSKKTLTKTLIAGILACMIAVLGVLSQDYLLGGATPPRKDEYLKSDITPLVQKRLDI